jgi:hypothetical protein
MELDDRFFLPRLHPEIAGNPTVVLVDAPIPLPPVIKLAGGHAQPLAYRAFDHLEEAELVKVERRRGAAPVVTIQFPKAEAITESIIYR